MDTTDATSDAVAAGVEDRRAIEHACTVDPIALQHEVEGLRRALETRTVIGQAIGIVMTRDVLTADAAFAHLVGESSRTNTKLRDVAVAVVEEVERQARR